MFLEMYELTKLSDQDLHQKMLTTAERERALTAQMISMIEEAERRKFFLDFGYSTLFDYLTIGLKYSAAAAMRRISAARIACEIPEVKERIADGTLSLTHLSQADHFFRNEAKNGPGAKSMSTKDKRAVLDQVVNKSTREAEKVLIAMSSAPEQLKEDRIRPLTPELTQITFKANAEFMAQFEELKGLLAHQIPGASLSEIMAEAVKVAVLAMKKRKFKVRDKDMSGAKQSAASSAIQSAAPCVEQSAASSAIQSAACVEQSAASSVIQSAACVEQSAVSSVIQRAACVEQSAASDIVKGLKPSLDEGEDFNLVAIGTSGAGNKYSRYIPAAVKREVFLRDGGRCVAVNPLTGEVCGSFIGLEFDHFPIPWAKGGPSIASNLRISCKLCNRLHAVQSYGRIAVVESMV